MVVAALVCVQLALAAVSHDPTHATEGGDTHACVVCAVSHAQDAGPPVLGEVISPVAARLPAPEEAATPRLVAFEAAHPARGPPAPRA